MGRGPDLDRIIDSDKDKIRKLDAAIADRESQLGNDVENGIKYINAHTSGILTDKSKLAGKPRKNSAGSKIPELRIVGVLDSNADSYTKLSESYSLEVLNPIIDGAVKFAEDFLAGGENGVTASKLAADSGAIIKGILSLFAASSTESTKLNQTFCQFRRGEDNFVIYYASNSGAIAAQNAWGKKQLICITNLFIFAQVKENAAVTEAEVRQHFLDSIKTAEEQMIDMEVESITNPNLGDTIEKAQKMIATLKSQYDAEG